MSRSVKLTRDESGQEVLEFALTLPILLVILFGVFEFGNLIDVRHALTGLIREGANIASRGTALQTSLDNMMDNGSDIGLSNRGGGIISVIEVQDGTPRIVEQLATDGFTNNSQLGGVGDEVSELSGLGLTNGQRFHAMEVLYDYAEVTPFGRLVTGVVQDTMYDRAIF